MIGIYKIQSLIKPEHYYIGSSVNIKTRFHSHINLLRKKNHPNCKLQRHYNKYGESDLQFLILLECPKEDLLNHEQFFIDTYRLSFNICRIAGTGRDRKIFKNHSETTKIKMSIKHKGINNWSVGNKNAFNKGKLYKHYQYIKNNLGVKKQKEIAKELNINPSTISKLKKLWKQETKL
jgi:group I intron endonuclease